MPGACVQVKEGARYEARRAEIEAFNKAHPWLKRGISLTHCRRARA
jgi:xanthine dehydrogenase molybdopterin-binding subunit B